MARFYMTKEQLAVMLADTSDLGELATEVALNYLVITPFPVYGSNALLPAQSGTKLTIRPSGTYSAFGEKLIKESETLSESSAIAFQEKYDAKRTPLEVVEEAVQQMVKRNEGLHYSQIEQVGWCSYARKGYGFRLPGGEKLYVFNPHNNKVIAEKQKSALFLSENRKSAFVNHYFAWDFRLKGQPRLKGRELLEQLPILSLHELEKHAKRMPDHVSQPQQWVLEQMGVNK